MVNFANNLNLSSAELLESRGNEFFFTVALKAGHVQVTVSDAGASALGLDADEVYRVTVRGRNADHTSAPDVGVWLDTATILSSGTGACS